MRDDVDEGETYENGIKKEDDMFHIRYKSCPLCCAKKEQGRIGENELQHNFSCAYGISCTVILYFQVKGKATTAKKNVTFG